VILCPARLEPVFSPRPWGSLSLAPFFPEKSNLSEPLGEAWMTGLDCQFAGGPFAGRKLTEAWREMPAEWRGTSISRDAPFPLLVKFIFTEQKLSVQVHPDDDYAARHEKAAGGRGKTEMWYIVNALPGSEVMVGLEPAATKEGFRRSIQDGTAENLLTRIPVIPGDAIYVPAGTVHTIGSGLVLCEIQEYSDLTYRVYDYNRRDAQGKSRELHIEKAMDVIRFGEQRGGKIQPVQTKHGDLSETYLAACRYFVTVKWEFSRRVAASTSREHFDLLIFLDGCGSFHWAHQQAEYAPMQVWLLPAALGAYELAPSASTSALRAYVPDNLSDFARQLVAEGISQENLSRILHP
jgi:mannose-6-phosphate isomerase